MKRHLFAITAVLTALFSVSIVSANDGISSIDAARAGLKLDWTMQVNVSPKGGEIVDIHLDVNEDRARTFFAINFSWEKGKDADGNPIMITTREEVFSEYGIGPNGLPYGTDPAIANMEAGLRRQIELAIRAGRTNSQIKDEIGVAESTTDRVRGEMTRRVEEAEEAANVRKEVLQLMMERQNRAVTVAVEKIVLPKSTLYVTTSTGLVHAIDADTGETRWQNAVGNETYPTIGAAANHNHVAVINGSSLYCLDAESGKLLWSKPCRDAIVALPVLSDEFIFIPLVDGRLEAFSIENEGISSESYVSIGIGRSRPLVTENSVCWSTDRGYFTVASNRTVESPRYRLRSEAPFIASGTAKGGVLFIGAVDGFAYAIEEKTGVLLWEVSTGQRIKQSMIPVGDYVYIITDEEKMYKLFSRTGVHAPGWSEPIEGVKRYVGASQDKIYVQNSINQVVALNQADGSQVSTLLSDSTAMIYPNYQTDRLYVGNAFGGVQCLREIGSETPFFHADEITALAQGAEMERADEGGQGGDADPFAGFNNDDQKNENKSDPFDAFNNNDKAKDPFGNDMKDDKAKDPFGGGGNDPFGGGSSEKKSNDPFGGGGNDPFGGGGDKAKDPFGGGDKANDPFGGGSDKSDDKGKDPFGGGGATDDPFGGN